MLLPYASDRPPRNPPLAVVCLVLAHFAFFGLVALIIAVRGQAIPVVWYANMGLVPGAMRWYAPFTYGLLHEDVFHLAVNMLFLWVFGGSVEDAIGWRRFVGLYVGASVVTGLVQVGMVWAVPGADRFTPIVGASGAVSAVMGVFALRFYRSRIRFIGLPWQIPALPLLVVVLVAEMATALWELLGKGGSPGSVVAHWAHIAGFGIGMAWAHATRLMRAGRQEYLASDAVQAMEAGSPLSAVHRWEAILKTNPADLHAEGELARAWEAAGDREQSVRHYRHAIVSLLEKGARKEAAIRYREMITAYPDERLEEADLFAVARALEETADYETALGAFEVFLALYPLGRDAEMALLRTGVIRLKRLHDPEGATGQLQRFLERYPESQWNHYASELLRSARLPTG